VDLSQLPTSMQPSFQAVITTLVWGDEPSRLELGAPAPACEAKFEESNQPGGSRSQACQKKVAGLGSRLKSGGLKLSVFQPLLVDSRGLAMESADPASGQRLDSQAATPLETAAEPAARCARQQQKSPPIVEVPVAKKSGC
jgi:hypothetical protein